MNDELLTPWDFAHLVSLGVMTRDHAVEALSAAGFVDADAILRDLLGEVAR